MKDEDAVEDVQLAPHAMFAPIEVSGQVGDEDDHSDAKEADGPLASNAEENHTCILNKIITCMYMYSRGTCLLISCKFMH